MTAVSIRNLRRLCCAALCAAICLLGAPGAHPSSATRPDLSRLVAVGDSLLAGYQNDSLLDVQQVNGPASLLAAQAGVPLPLPLIAPPGVPNVLIGVDPGPPPVFVRAPGVSTGRVNPLVQPMNLAVPGHRVHDALATQPSLPIDSLTDLVLGIPSLFSGVARSQVEWAEALAPTTLLLWIGSSDALGSIFIANPAALTPLASFQTDLAQVMVRLAATGANMVVVNIPDVTHLPYLTSAEHAAELVGQPLALIGPLLGIAAGDSITPDGLALMASILAGTTVGPLPGNVVLTASEAATIRAAIGEYNTFIAAQALQYGATFVDARALFDRIDAEGFVVRGRRLTTAFLGGIFSLDGIHATNTGYAIVANEIIKAMNRQSAAGIPLLSVATVAAADPLVRTLLPGLSNDALIPSTADR